MLRICTTRIFGRTDLRIGVSGAKFDAESDFEVRLAVAPQKTNQNSEKLIFRPPKKVVIFFVFGVEKRNVGDRLKRVLTEGFCQNP